MTYKVVAAVKTVDLVKMADKIVELSGSLATDLGNTGQFQRPLPTVREVRQARRDGQACENTAFYFANGTLTAQSIREVSRPALPIPPNADK